jgi:glycosyltransferase involved in cell wall biosynthesis
MREEHEGAPLVSVVIPSFNHRRFIREAIRSVYRQTYRPIELIIIDDGSKDGSAAIIRDFFSKELAPDGISVDFSARPNRGAHATINEGIAKAHGHYVTILNSDDAYAPERIAVCVATARQRNSRLVFTYVEAVDAAGQPLKPGHYWLNWYYDAQVQELDVAPSVGFALLNHNIAVTTGNLFFRRDLYDQVGPFDNYRYAHDLDFLMRTLELEEPTLLRQVLYKYRIHEANTIQAKHADIVAELERVYRRYLVSVLTTPPANTLAPTFSNWPSSFSSVFTPSSVGLTGAIDGLLETSRPETGLEQARIAPAHPQQPPSAAVTLISHELSRTGAPTLALEVARSMVAAGAEVNVISLSDGPLRAEFESAGIAVKVLPLAIRRDTATGQFLVALARWIRYIDRWGIIRSIAMNLASLRMAQLYRHVHDCVLINSFASWPIALKVIRYCRRARIFWYIHESYDPALMLRRPADMQSFQSARKQSNLAFLFGSDGTRRVWAGNGCDGQVRYWSGLSSATKRQPFQKGGTGQRGNGAPRAILSVGTSGTRKGTRTLIEAFAYGRSHRLIDDDVELVIVGCVPPSWHVFTRDLIVRVHQADLLGKVRLVGNVEASALEPFYAAASVYVQSSTMECLPLALLMAMAYRLPIVSTDVDGCSEAILDGVCGLTVPPRDTVRLAEAMGRMLANPAEGERFGHAARERFEQVFSLEATTGPLLRSLFPDGSVTLPKPAPGGDDADTPPDVHPMLEGEAGRTFDRPPGERAGAGNRLHAASVK